ncbi:MAG: D-alanine--D-alanine ligase [Polyangia bacterium]|jgi:D-alanine-D-alanine ligase
MPDDPGEPSTRTSESSSPFHEQRVLVLHNVDFPDNSDEVLGHESRLDVVNQAHDVSRALVTHDHFVDVMGIDRDDLADLLGRLREDPPDLVFNLVESLAQLGLHEKVVPSLLELFDVPFTGSGAMTIALCGNKQRAKQILKAEGLQTPRWAVLDGVARSRVSDVAAVSGVGYPAIVKLLAEDGSLGLTFNSVVFDDDGLRRQLKTMREQFPGRKLLVEQYIDGRELYVSMLGDRLLPIAELDMSSMPPEVPRIVTYDCKWDKNSPDYHYAPTSMVAVGLSPAVTDRVLSVARQCFTALGVTDYGRIDLRLAKDGTPYVLEVNPNCDLSDGAGLAKAARAAGIPYDQVIETIGVSAKERFASEQLPLKQRVRPIRSAI